MSNISNLGKLKLNEHHSVELRDMLLLRYEPIAFKLIENENDVPACAIHPIKDLGKHMCLCQAYAMTRRDRKTIYMDKTSEWCWCPLVSFGLVECSEGSKQFEMISSRLGIKDQSEANKFFSNFPKLEFGKYRGIVTAPLNVCDFEPDIVLIYCNNAQLRSLLFAVKSLTGKIVNTQMDAIDSCVYSTIPTLKTREFRVTLPDLGEYERAMADEDEIILTVPSEQMDGLITCLRTFDERNMGYRLLSKDMHLDFPRPPFYNELFDMWGLEQGEDWSK